MTMQRNELPLTGGVQGEHVRDALKGLGDI